MIKKYVSLLVLVGVIFLFMIGLVIISNKYHPLLNHPDQVIKEMESDALFYTESPLAVESSFLIKKKCD